MNTELERLESRMSRLESRNRVLQLALVSCLAFLLLGAAGDPDVISARSLQLLSADGSVAAELATRDGTPGLYLLDENGVDRVAVFHSADTSGMYVMDSDAVTRIGVAQFSHGGGGFALHGPESKGAAVLYLKKNGSLRFFDADGNVTNQVLAKPPIAIEE